MTNKKGKQVKEYLGFEHGSTKVWEVAQVNQQFYDEGLLPKNRDFKPSCAKAVAPPIVRELTPAVKNGEKHLVDYVRQPDGKSLGTPGQVI